jgi:ankyrin repeat protein
MFRYQICLRTHTQTLRLLIRARANLEIMDENGNRPLHIAVLNSNECVRELVQGGEYPLPTETMTPINCRNERVFFIER